MLGNISSPSSSPPPTPTLPVKPEQYKKAFELNKGQYPKYIDIALHSENENKYCGANVWEINCDKTVLGPLSKYRLELQSD